MNLVRAQATFDTRLSLANSPRRHYRHKLPLTSVRALGEAAVEYRRLFWESKGRQTGFIRTLKANYARSQVTRVYEAIDVYKHWHTIEKNGWVNWPLSTVLDLIR